MRALRAGARQAPRPEAKATISWRAMETARPWWHQVRLLPGGDQGVATAIVVTGAIYLLFLFMGWLAAFIFMQKAGISSDDFGVAGGSFAVGNGLPLLIIVGWTGLRVRLSQPIERDEAAADLAGRRVFFGDETPRVPRGAYVVSTRPRQVSARMQDGRAMTIFFRVNTDPEDLLRLGHVMRGTPGLEVEDWVHQKLSARATELLPDPDGIKDALVTELLPRGIVITRVEVA
jgi:hypothetical protein